VSHLRANEIEGEAKAEAVRQADPDLSGPRAEQAADTRAMTAVGAGAVTSLDAGGARSLQRMAGNAAFTAAVQRDKDDKGGIDGSSVHSTISSGGQAMDPGLQREMGAAYNTDFSNVQLHTGSDAAQSAADMNANAYTVGNHVVLGAGVDPSSSAGKETVAHEAEANGARVASGGNAEVASAGITAGGAQRQAIQRDVEGGEGTESEDEGGDPLQKQVQRATAEEGMESESED
jgi:hypothetical protein